MNRLIIIIVMIVLVLMGGVVPQVVHGADDDDNLLTSDEEKFLEDWVQVHDQLEKIRYSMMIFYKDHEYDYFKEKLSSAKNASDVIRELKKRFEFEGSCQLNTAPTIFRDIQTLWNTKVCNQYGKMRLAIEAALVPSIGKESWLALGEKIKPENELLSQIMSNVDGMIGARLTKLKQERQKAGINPKAIEKEVKKEVKKELSKDDAGKSNDDSDDLFDFDCFIATAAYGTPSAKEIDELRRFRDECLRDSYLGNEFIKFYYKYSPPIADFISKHEILRTVVREGFVDPIVKVVEFTENWWAE